MGNSFDLIDGVVASGSCYGVGSDGIESVDIADVLQFLLDGMLVMNVENMHTDCITSSHLDLDLVKP